MKSAWAVAYGESGETLAGPCEVSMSEDGSLAGMIAIDGSKKVKYVGVYEDRDCSTLIRKFEPEDDSVAKYQRTLINGREMAQQMVSEALERCGSREELASFCMGALEFLAGATTTVVRRPDLSARLVSDAVGRGVSEATREMLLSEIDSLLGKKRK